MKIKSILIPLAMLLKMSFASAMTEGEIAGVIQAGDQGEINISATIPANSDDQELIDFGTMLTVDHNVNLVLLDSFFTPTEILSSDQSVFVKAQADMNVIVLGTLKDTNFNIAYLDHEIAVDKLEVKDLDTFIQNATRPTFKTFLADTQVMVQKHLTQATVLRGQLQ